MREPKKKSSGVKNIARTAIWLLAGVLLAGVALPKFMNNRQLALRNACVNYLGQIHSAKEQWVLDYKSTTNNIPTWDDLKP